ncbi:DUF1002 domain-containing protein [Streptococcus pluranimalium]|uniref:DUF1002 domain-containing protein n=1 Tax=Streptococcus pluranimalium TaxID=82348 RepID=UPI0024153C4E|nr:DUF1002 domain-containing protein [Streptococcus pluranimalium]MDY3042392.1 DUF1002 domain-containing protein [Streptococcus pluranimalium]WFM80759.1 DUF1002 domain-containing protein [Streptococcus pluranimalium]
MSIKKQLTTAGVILASLSFSGVALAESQVQSVIDESYVQPDYVLGYSLSDSQKQETLRLLDYQEGRDTDLKTLNTSSYAKIMDVADDSSLQLYSSVKIKKLGSSKTLTVNIVTPENITKVTEDMYRNAAVTLGIQHADIEVASPIPVTGESALAGIYYSLEENGAQVSDESKALAQEELNALSDINQENQGKEGYDADKLNVALTDIKSAVAQSGKDLSKEDVQKIVEDTLENYNLKSSMTDNQINLIVNFAVNLSNSGVISNGDFVNTLSDLKDSIVSKAKGNFKGIDVDFDANKAIEQGKGIWQQIVDFFKNLIG